jgi:hypothetical protein
MSRSPAGVRVPCGAVTVMGMNRLLSCGWFYNYR